MSFVRYPHLEKFGNQEVEGIEHGETYVFPKIDGANASVWFRDRLRFGSRNRELTLDNDNAGFMGASVDDPRYVRFFEQYPRLRLFGEWLVPHTLTGYIDIAWNKFYVFDVYDDETQQFLNYGTYKVLIDKFAIDYIPCFWRIKDGDLDDFAFRSKECRYLLKDETPQGEGIVIKNYNWINKYGRQTWAKLVNAEFKTENMKVFGPSLSGGQTEEEKIVNFAVTSALVEKEYSKIVMDNGGWSTRYIPRLLETVFYCLVTEELWSTLKKVNFPTVNFKSLRHYTVAKIKELKPELF